MLRNIYLSLFFVVFSYSFSFEQPVFITGATSKVGKRVVEKLASKGIKTRCLIRDYDKAEQLFGHIDDVHLVKGDILDTTTLGHIMKGCSVSVNLHGVYRRSNPLHKLKFYDLHNKIEDKNHPYYVNFIGMKNIITSCKENNIDKIVRVTGLATAFSDSHPIPLLFNSLYSDNIFWHKNSESDIISSGLSYTILRPGAIKDKEYEYVKLSDEITKPPGLIGVDNLADIIVQTILPSRNILQEPYRFKNRIVACNGYNTKKGLLKKGVLSLLHH
tara:strand:- start:276 stop:1094 length:819 start_codon:yes stop_codon:yes gene_type:complete